MTDMFTKFRSKMTALPSKLAKKLEGKQRAEIQRILKEEIDNALVELSNYNAADFIRTNTLTFPGTVSIR